MAMTPEAKVKKQIRKILDTTRTYYAMPIGTGYGSSGVPDFLACHDGHFVGIEAKAGKGKTTALQEDNLQRIRDSGGSTLVINESNLNELEELLCKKDER
jgi:Holliday junction resolvase